jgi:hypothetical protein
MKIPNQIIPESQKTKSHIEKTIKAIALNCSEYDCGKKGDYESWMLYNEQFYESDYNYLRKVGNFTLPAKFRWIGVQRPRINLLASQQIKRPWVYSLRVSDIDSKKEKLKNKSKYKVDWILQQIQSKKIALQSQIIALQQQVQQIEQNLQREPQSEEEAAQFQQIAQQLPQVKLIIQQQTERLSKEVLYTEKEAQDLEIYLGTTWQEKKEWYAQILSDKAKLKLNLKDKSKEGLISRCVTGKEYYYVDYKEGKVLPEFINVDDVKVFFPKISNIDYVEDGPWVCMLEGMTMDQVMAQFGKDLSEEQIKKIESELTYDTYLDSEQSKKEATISSPLGYSGTENMGNMIKVWKIYFKSPRKIYIKSSPNPYKEGSYFRKFISEEEANNVGTKYKNSIRTDKGDKLDIRYVTDIYEGYYIENLQCVVKAQKKKYNRTYMDDYMKKDLPIYGPTFSRVSKRPYSLIRATEDLQKLLNILHYHRELLLALSGTKGTIVDLSQIPAGMSPEEHQYHKKMGSLYIQTVTKGGRKINSSFNQWHTYDESLSPAIQYIDQMIMNTDQMIGYLMGIGPQRMGQVVAGDQVGKTEMAIQQNALITEIIYYEHDLIFNKAFESFMNLATKYCMHEGGIISREDDVYGEQQVIVPAGTFKDVEFELHTENSTEEETALVQLKELAVQKHLQGALPFSNLVSMYRVKALKELEKKMEYFEAKAMELAQQAQSGQMQEQAQLEQQRIQIENQYKAEIEKQKSQLAAMNIQVEEAKLQFEREKLQVESELKDKEIRTKMTTEIYKVDKDAAVEMNYLQEQQRQAIKDEELRELTLKVDTMVKQIELSMAKTGQLYDAINTSKKIKVEERKASVSNKERIKD